MEPQLAIFRNLKILRLNSSLKATKKTEEMLATASAKRKTQITLHSTSFLMGVI
jgi:hypothetical protein